MQKIRVERVNERVKKELSQILQRELKDPRIQFVTVMDVKVTGDLQQACVYVSVLGDEERKKDVLAGLEKAKGFIRTEVGKRIRLRHTPELIFKLDESIAYGAHINELLHQIERKGE